MTDDRARLAPDQQALVVGALEQARHRGFLGPGPVEPHVGHALGFAVAAGGPVPRFVDLGSGGGIPGLVLALLWPTCRAVLVDASATRCTHLRDAVESLGLGARIEVRHARAEELGRDIDLRGAVALVVARSFGPPAVVAECAAPLLHVGGTLITSEPPDATDRWDAPEALAALGMRAATTVEVEGRHYHRCDQVDPCPDRFPRRVGVPSRRPLF